MWTVQQLLDDAIQYDQPLLAHALFCGIQDGTIHPGEPVEGLDYGRLDLEKVKELSERNVLQIRPVKLYAFPIDPVTKSAAFVLAYDEKTAIQSFVAYYKRHPQKIVDATDRIDASISFGDTEKVMSFWEIRKQTQTFPRFVAEICR